MKRAAEIFVDIKAHMESGVFIRNHSTNRNDIREFTFSDVDLGSCKDILDLGCAYGFFTSGLAGRVRPDACVQGVDLWPGYKQYFLSACRKSGFDGQFCPSDEIFCKRYPDDSFDLVLCSYTLYFFPQAIPEIARVLRPNGHFIAVTHIIPHMFELVTFIKQCIYKYLGLSVQYLPLEKLFERFSNVNGREMLSGWFRKIDVKQYANSLKIDEASLSDLCSYLCFKRPKFFPEDCGIDNEFIQTIVVDSLRELVRKVGMFTISKSDTVYICQYPQNTNCLAK